MHVFNKVIFTTASKTIGVKGFTILELVVAAAVSLSVLGASLGMLTKQRAWLLTDQTRATANDNLRLVSDLIGQDIKQAGERLSANTQLPGISIVPGASGTPSTLILQRQLLTETLPVCQTITAGSTTASIDVSVVNGIIGGIDYGAAVANCTYSYKSPTGGELSTTLTTLKPTDNLRAWRTYRCTQGSPTTGTTDPCTTTNSNTTWAYIYQQDTPTSGHGEFFQYSIEGQGSCISSTALPGRTCQRIVRSDSKPWIYGYKYNDPAVAQPQLYLLEERRYSAKLDDSTTSNPNDYILQLGVNGQTPKHIANQLSNFQVWAKVPANFNATPFSAPVTWGCAAGGSAATAPNPSIPNQWYCSGFNANLANQEALKPQFINDWQQLQGVRLTLTSINPNANVLKVDTSTPNNALVLSSEFFPRNVYSN